ncbi:MAG TPA: hypothetical protein VLM75_08650 [Spirochaetota bacterium]|nr:hypothetical protein [Spirochaetota bacterium]
MFSCYDVFRIGKFRIWQNIDLKNFGFCDRPEGLSKSMAIEGVKIHLYGKKTTKPYRKMEHVTILSSSLECALKKAEKVKQLIKVKSWKES